MIKSWNRETPQASVTLESGSQPPATAWLTSGYWRFLAVCRWNWLQRGVVPKTSLGLLWLPADCLIAQTNMFTLKANSLCRTLHSSAAPQAAADERSSTSWHLAGNLLGTKAIIKRISVQLLCSWFGFHQVTASLTCSYFHYITFL